MTDRINGRTVVVTGAARGIGYATARALLARGARVVIGDRDLGALRTAVDALGERASGHPLDVTDRDSFADFLDKARAKLHSSAAKSRQLLARAGGGAWDR